MDPVEIHELMRYRVQGLFRHDHRGRTVSINQWDGGSPPRFHLGRTSRGSVCRIRADIPEPTAQALLDLVRREPPLTDPRESPANLAGYVDLLHGEGDEAATTGSGPVYWFADAIAPSRSPVIIDGGNADLLRGGLEGWAEDVPHRQPLLAVIEDGRAVAVCASVRITTTTHEVGVETLPEYRRRGHAVNVVAGWAQELRRRGITRTFYSTSWENVASQRVASRLGLSLIGADFQVT
jgi:GNAT superfamily N-acetyltransferase